MRRVDSTGDSVWWLDGVYDLDEGAQMVWEVSKSAA